MELDIWISDYNLALEYQGEQHYHPYLVSAFGHNSNPDLYAQRDRQKAAACKLAGMTPLTTKKT